MVFKPMTVKMKTHWLVPRYLFYGMAEKINISSSKSVPYRWYTILIKGSGFRSWLNMHYLSDKTYLIQNQYNKLLSSQREATMFIIVAM